MDNVKIGDKRTYDDWGLALLSVHVTMPEAKVNQVDIPGADGVMDLTDSLGPVRYGNREIRLEFDATATPKPWYTLISEIAGYLHGKKLKVILDSDPGYFYLGRLSMEAQENDYYTGRVTISGDMEPYKYELCSSMERWKWNSLNFRTGTIRNYRDLTVQGQRRVRILGRKKEVTPTIYSNAAMEVEWMGKRYPVLMGKTKIYAISIPEGENYLTFFGNGIISIDYRGGIL